MQWEWPFVINAIHNVITAWKCQKSHFSMIMNFSQLLKNCPKQACIPVGCVPPACCPYLPACTALGGYLLPGGVYLPRYFPPLWTEWQTGVKILPCPKLRLRAVITLWTTLWTTNSFAHKPDGLLVLATISFGKKSKFMTEVGRTTFLYHSNKYLHIFSAEVHNYFHAVLFILLHKNVINISSYALSHSPAQRRPVATCDFTLH